MEPTPSNIPEILNWIERFGISFAILCVFLFVLLKVGYWLGEKVIVPVVTGHTGFLTEVKNAVWDIAKSNILINSNMEQLIDIQKENSENIKKLIEINQEKPLVRERKTTIIPKTEISRHESIAST